MLKLQENLSTMSSLNNYNESIKHNEKLNSNIILDNHHKSRMLDNKELNNYLNSDENKEINLKQQQNLLLELNKVIFLLNKKLRSKDKLIFNLNREKVSLIKIVRYILFKKTNTRWKQENKGKVWKSANYKWKAN